MDQPKKRRLRAPAQSVRQAAEKAQAGNDKPRRVSRARRTLAAAGRPFARILQPTGRFIYKVFNRQPFRFIGKILRFIALILGLRFVGQSIRELKYVTWPTRRETRQLTFAVLAFAIVFGIFVTVVDFGLDKLFKALIVK